MISSYRYGILHHTHIWHAIQYEPQFYWFEVVIILHKCFMTGALVIIGENTTVQPLAATLFQLGFLLTVLKLSPCECVFVSSRRSWGAFLPFF